MNVVVPGVLEGESVVLSVVDSPAEIVDEAATAVTVRRDLPVVNESISP